MFECIRITQKCNIFVAQGQQRLELVKSNCGMSRKKDYIRDIYHISNNYRLSALLADVIL